MEAASVGGLFDDLMFSFREFGRDRWRVHSISHLLLAFTQPVASFFAPFLHFPVTGVSRLVGQNYFRIGSHGRLS
jgi:hypothetical protein